MSSIQKLLTRACVPSLHTPPLSLRYRIKARTAAVFPVSIHPHIIQATCIIISKLVPLMTIRHIPPLHSSLPHPLPRPRDEPYAQTRLKHSPRNSRRISSHLLHMHPLPPTRLPRTPCLPPMPNSGNKNLGRLSSTRNLLLPSQCRRR